MARNYSSSAKEAINSLGGYALPVFLLEIDHPDLVTPVRVTNDTQDITSNGNVFTSLAFDIVPPDDLTQGLPRARLRVDNVGRDLTSWLESSGGGKDATVRLMQVMRSAPNVLELDLTMSLDNVSMTMLEVSADLGFDDVLNRPACTVTYTPTVAPGLY